MTSMNPTDHTIRETFAAFDRDLEPRCRPTTRRLYGHIMERFVVWLEATYPPIPPTVRQLGFRDGARYREYLRGRQLQPTTINTTMAALERWGTWVVAVGLRPDNPFATMQRIRTEDRQRAPKALTPRQQDLLLKATTLLRQPTRATLIISLLLHTGLRVAELCALTWGDLTVAERSGHLRVRAGKGETARTVPLNSEIRRTLWTWLITTTELASSEPPSQRVRWTTVHAQLMATWITQHAVHPVIPSQKGGPLLPRAVQTIVTQAAAHARITDPPTTPHTLRHTYATQLVTNGAPLTVVATLLGHRSLTTTAIYTKPSAQELTRWTDTLALE